MAMVTSSPGWVLSGMTSPGCRYSRSPNGTVVTSSAGYPLDTTYYQTVKGMVTPGPLFEEFGF